MRRVFLLFSRLICWVLCKNEILIRLEIMQREFRPLTRVSVCLSGVYEPFCVFTFVLVFAGVILVRSLTGRRVIVVTMIIITITVMVITV